MATDRAGNEGSASFTVTVNRDAGHAPACSAAVADPAVLWPPNHRLVPIMIKGLTDPDGDRITVRITGIFQDEPTNGGGDGHTAIDGYGVGTNKASVRAERSGNRNGRVYHIRFSATDPGGLSCTGEVLVGVPHDKAHHAVDDGPRFDSTRAGPANDSDEHHDCGDDQDHNNRKGKERDSHEKKFHGATRDDDRKEQESSRK